MDASNSDGNSVVLIVGAGASCKYGFPLGTGLRRTLEQPLDRIAPNIKLAGSDVSALIARHDEFREHLRDSHHESIDAFLERRSDLRKAGSFAIAASLIDQQITFAREIPGPAHWICPLYKRWLSESGMDDLGQAMRSRNLTIVTFNYDLTIETALARLRRADTNEQYSFIFDGMDEWPLIHVHGNLQCHDEVENVLARKFDHSALTQSLATQAAKSMKLTGDSLGRDNELDDGSAARKAVWSADRVVFVGFGFDPRNLNKVGIGPEHSRWIAKPRKIFSTHVGMSDRATASAHQAVAAGISWVGSDSGDACEQTLSSLWTAD